MECEETWPRTPLRQPDLSPKIKNIGQVKILGSGEIKNVSILLLNNIYQELSNIALGTLVLLNPWRV